VKVSTNIRFALVAMSATLACVGVLQRVPGVSLFGILCFVLIEGPDLKKPIPQEERRQTIAIAGVVVAVLLGRPFWH